MLEFVLPGVSNQLHLLGRPGPSGESPANEGPPTSGEYINFSNSVKYIRIIFPEICDGLRCGFRRDLWKSSATVALVVLEQSLAQRNLRPTRAFYLFLTPQRHLCKWPLRSSLG